tara:strand:- start:790 stop:1485 length:696 start_codon:yes stop_codon:yes gene_type:complete
MFDAFIINTVGIGLNKSLLKGESILEKSFKRGIKSQEQAFSGIYTNNEFITLDFLKSYAYSALLKSKENFRHKATVLFFNNKSNVDTGVDFSSLQKAFEDLLNSDKNLLSRTISTIINDAYQEGRAAGIKRSLGENPYVYKRPHADACSFCKSLYLKKDEVTPVVFKLKELMEAGINNDGRHHHRPETTMWKAVVGSTHPWCRCVIHPLQKGNSFDENGNVVESKGENFYW